MKSIVAAVLAGVAGCLVTLVMVHGNGDAWAARAEQVKEIRTERVVLVDAKGGLKAVLGTGNDGRPVFAMVDGKGNVRISIAISSNDSPAIGMTDSKNRAVIGLAVTNNDDAALTLTDNQGKVQAALGIQKGSGKLKLNGKDM
ncbi:MAG: hypothetical protein HY896_14045 [Deltaproteobacteria bacterium]|nr:hypothetical protein [Deltaproteobacteria bacterium]